MKRILSFLLCGLMLFSLCSCKKDDSNTDKTSSVVKYTTAGIPEYTGTQGDTIDVQLSGETTGNGSSVESVKVLPSGATVISVEKKMNTSSNSSTDSGTTDKPGDVPEEKVCHDFVLNYNTEDITILQLSDFCVIDSAQQRTNGTLNNQATQQYKKSNMKALLFDYIDKMVKDVKPDLILVTGNLVHGQFDDLGTSFKEVVNYMESLNIFWAPVFGDFEGISAQGAAWQCEQLIKAPHCLFKKTEGITGNSNYSIGIAVNGNIVRNIYMMDSNSCNNTSDLSVSTVLGLEQKQLDWLKASVENVTNTFGKKVPTFVAFNRPSSDISDTLSLVGYETDITATYEIGKDVASQNNDFGKKEDKLICGHAVGKLSETFKALGVDGVFMGRNSASNISVLYDGIRWTIGSKTGKYDTKYNINGGTKIVINSATNNFAVTNVSAE